MHTMESVRALLNNMDDGDILVSSTKANLNKMHEEVYDHISHSKNYHFIEKEDTMLTIVEIVETVTPILKEHGVKEAILFGSYAKGCATEQSDIDLYVDSGLRGLMFFGLLGDICDAFDIPVDLFDKRMLARNPEFQAEIFKTGVQVQL